MIKQLYWLWLVTFFNGALLCAQEIPLDVKASSLKFTGHAFLHDFNGEALPFTGTAQVNPNEPQIVTSAKITFKTPDMTTFESARDKNMKQWLEVEANPNIVFLLKSVNSLSDRPKDATKAKPADFHVLGELELHHQKHSVEGTAIGWREGSMLVVTGSTSINTEDYGLPQIRQLFLTVDKKVDITYRLVFDLPPAFQVATPN